MGNAVENDIYLDLIAIGQRLEIARKKRPLEEIEKLCGVGKSTIQRSERGEYPPQVKLLAFYRQEGISTDLILYGEEKGTQLTQVSLRILSLGLPLDQRAALAKDLLSEPQARGTT
jgi:transcriptional regulator with XRE-family HTH domain